MFEAKDLDRQVREEHEYWMRIALEEARKAGDLGEVPIGAILVKDQEIIGLGYNLREINRQATAHAEILAIQDANRKLGAWRLEGATLYVTLEPCPMCSGAILNARIDRLVYGASDPKAGCVGSLYNMLEDNRFNHQVEVIAGVLAEETGQILTEFFRKLRQDKKKDKLINR